MAPEEPSAFLCRKGCPEEGDNLVASDQGQRLIIGCGCAAHTDRLAQTVTGGYRQYSFSLARYIGQTIKLRFTGTETLGGGYNTSFFEDDNALNVS